MPFPSSTQGNALERAMMNGQRSGQALLNSAKQNAARKYGENLAAGRWQGMGQQSTNPLSDPIMKHYMDVAKGRVNPFARVSPTLFGTPKNSQLTVPSASSSGSSSGQNASSFATFNKGGGPGFKPVGRGTEGPMYQIQVTTPGGFRRNYSGLSGNNMHTGLL